MAKTQVEISTSSSSRASSRAAAEFADLERIVNAGAATYEQLLRYQKLGPGLGKDTSWVNEGHITRARARSAQRDLNARNIAESNSSSRSSARARVITDDTPPATVQPASGTPAQQLQNQGITLINQIIGSGNSGEDNKPEPDPVVPPGPDPPGPKPPGTGPGEDIKTTTNPLKWVDGKLPGLNWLPMALAPLSALGALGQDPVFNRHETSQFWRDDFKKEFAGISKDARTDPYQGSFFRNANRAALTSTNVMLANNAAVTEKQRLSGGQVFAGGTSRAIGDAAAGFYANQGNLLSRAYSIRDQAAMQENQYVNHNTDKNQELFQFEVAQGTHSAYNRGMNLFNRALSGAMAGAGAGLSMTGKLFDLTTQKAMAEQSLGHYEGGGGTTEIIGRKAEQDAKDPQAGVPPAIHSDPSDPMNQFWSANRPDPTSPNDPINRLDNNINFINATNREALMGTPTSRRQYARESIFEGGDMPGFQMNANSTGFVGSPAQRDAFDFATESERQRKKNQNVFGW